MNVRKFDIHPLFKGSSKTSMLCANSTTCSAQLPEGLTGRYSQGKNKRWQRLLAFVLPLIFPCSQLRNFEYLLALEISKMASTYRYLHNILFPAFFVIGARQSVTSDASKIENNEVLAEDNNPKQSEDKDLVKQLDEDENREEEEPDQKEPGQEESKEEESDQEEPSQEELGQGEPDQEEPNQEEPGQEEPSQEEPTEEESDQNEPAQEQPDQEDADQEEPSQRETSPTDTSDEQGPNQADSDVEQFENNGLENGQGMLLLEL